MEKSFFEIGQIYYVFSGPSNVLELTHALLCDIEHQHNKLNFGGKTFLLVHSSKELPSWIMDSGIHTGNTRRIRRYSSLRFARTTNNKAKSATLMDDTLLKRGKDGIWRGNGVVFRNKQVIELNEDNFQYWLDRINRQKR